MSKTGSYTKPLTFSSEIKYIGANAFHECANLTSIENLVAETIDTGAFEDCINLNSISGFNPRVIGNNAFKGCAELSDELEIKSVTTVGESAFYGCGFSKVILPNSINSIGYRGLGYTYGGIKIDGFTIRGYKGTAAEQYANDNGFTFEPITKKISTFSVTVDEPVAGESLPTRLPFPTARSTQ